MHLGALLMPSHPPERSVGEGQAWDLEELERLNLLGFAEAWVGEHFTAAWEPCPAPDLLIAQGLQRTKRIRLTDETIERIISGQRPAGLTEEEGCAYDVAAKLCAGGVLPGPPYEQALESFDDRNTYELVYLCGFYGLACMTMNAFVAPPTPQ